MKDFIFKIKNFFMNISNIISWIPTLWNDKEWDYSFMLEIEYNKLKNMIHWYETNDYGSCTSGETVVKQMKLAVSLLDIILEKYKWWHINFPDGYKFFDENHKYEPIPDENYIIEPYVNINNWKRFMPNLKQDTITKHPNLWRVYIRAEKAWRLYHMIREKYMRDWWD